MLIDATHAEETRVVVVDGNKVEEFDFESENRRQLAGNIYLAKVTRVEPSLQAAFVDYGGNRHGFLAFSEIHPDYYQIPVADRRALLEEERAYAEAQAAKDEEETKPKRRSRGGRGKSRSKAEDATSADAKSSKEIEGMETVDLDDEEDEINDEEGSSPMERVPESPVDTPEHHEEEAEASDSDEEGDEEEAKGPDAAAKDESIEAVADDDDQEDIRPARKPRPRRYKIQEVIKVRQVLLVQVVKEERGNKGAALTTYLSLAGRYCVLMPNTARGGGISRKITNAADRKKLKEIANEIKVPQGAGLIVRTAGAKRTRAEIKRDYEYLQRLWEQIRELTLKSIAPTKIYEEGDLIKRSIRDLYNREIDEVFVEGERGYRIAKDFMKMIMPSHAKNVKRYEDPLPLFARYQVESYLSAMFNPTVQLPSGGYIVIGVTEALVAIDVNSGRATKEGSIEQTALKTNLEAAEEVARQLRLRDLAGLIVIDFIDMDERKNNAAVEKRMKDKLKTDRARIQVGRISGFGLMEMSRQRLRPGMIEATTQPCQACHGTGLVRSDDNLALAILRQIEEEGTRRRTREVLLKVPVGIGNYLMNQKREHVAHIEARYGLSVRIEGDPHLISPEFTMEKFKTATRNVAQPDDHVVSVDTSLMEQVDEDEAEAAAEEAQEEEQQSSNRGRDNGDENGDGEGKPKRRRRRRRSRGGRGRSSGQRGESQENGENGENGDSDEESRSDAQEAEKAEASAEAAEAVTEETPEAEAAPAEIEEKPKRKRTTRSRTSKAKEEAEAAADGDAKVTSEEAPEEKPKPKRTRKSTKKKAEEETPAAEGAEATEEAPAEKPKRKRAPAKSKAKAEEGAEAEEKPKRSRARKKKADPAPEAEAATPEAEAQAEVQEGTPAPEAVPPAAEPATPVESPVQEAREEAAPEAESAPEPEAEKAPEPVTAAAEESAEAEAEEDKKPKKRGWWSLGRG
jgi:ribonuclease E